MPLAVKIVTFLIGRKYTVEYPQHSHKSQGTKFYASLCTTFGTLAGRVHKKKGKMALFGHLDVFFFKKNVTKR